MTLPELQLILSQIAYKDWVFHSALMGDGFYLQVRFVAPDNDQPGSTATLPQHGRKFYVSTYSTKGEVVQTALLACLLAEEHECRELFRYRGARLFGPHFDADELAEFALGAQTEHRS